MRVLIIDDEEKVAKDFGHHLKMRFSAECFYALTLDKGLQMRTNIRDLDAIVVDLSFPDAKREETITAIPLFAEIAPTFVLSGHADKELFDQARTAGARRCYVKGVDGSVLAGELAELTYQAKPEQRNELSQPLWNLRQEQAEPKKRGAWLTTAHTAAALIILLVLNLAGLVAYIWNQSAANALFRKQVVDVVQDVALLKQRTDTLHDQAQYSIQDRQQINKRLDDKDHDYSLLRAEMSAGFTKIYDVLLQDRQARNDKGRP